MNLSDETKQAIIDLQQLYPEKRSALIPALHLAQAETGYLPSAIQAEVAKLFEIEENEVKGVVTFYDMFFEKPVGKHLLHVCKNASCLLRGADEVIDQFCQKLYIQPGETSADGLFTVIASECLAACDLAPVALVNDEIIGPIDKSHIENILINAQKSKGHACPIKTPKDK